MFQTNIQHLMEQIKRALQKTSGNKSGNVTLEPQFWYYGHTTQAIIVMVN
jgi:hypothetical protein